MLTDAGGDPAASCWRRTRDADCVGVIAWMHTFSPAKMWIAGLDALRKPLLHLHTQAQRGAAVGDDRHGLHEPQPGRARRPRVRLHPDPARRRPQDGRRPRRPTRRWSARIDALGPGRRRARPTCDRCGWPASATTCATSRSPRATRSRRELRFGVSVNTYGVNDLVARGRRGRPTPTSTRWSPSTTTRYRLAPELRRGRRAARVAALRRPHRGRAARSSSTTAGSARSPPTSRTSAGCGSCPGLAVQRLMADGYGFGGEGDWKTVGAAAPPQGDGRRRRPAAPRSWRTTPTTSAPGEPKILGAHMLEVCPTIAAGHAVAARSTRWASAAARTRSGWCSTPRPGPAVVVGLADLGDRFRLVANEIDVVAAGRAAAEAAGRPRGLEAAPGPVAPRPSPG